MELEKYLTGSLDFLDFCPLESGILVAEVQGCFVTMVSYSCLLVTSN